MMHANYQGHHVTICVHVYERESVQYRQYVSFQRNNKNYIYIYMILMYHLNLL